MSIFFITFAVLILFFIAMSVGVLMGRKPLKGSCGGVGKALGEKDYTCDICGDDPNKCEQEQDRITEDSVGNTALDDLAYDATKR